jgi:murein tripeptide amidase MpaA
MKLALLLTLAVVASVNAFRYDGYHLIEIDALHDRAKVDGVLALTDDDERIKQVIVMNEHVRLDQSIVLCVAPVAVNTIMEFLDQKGYNYVVLNNNLQKTYDEARVKNEEAKLLWRKSAQKLSKAAPTAYLQYDEQVAWLQSAAAASSIAETFSIGQSFEGRDMIAVSINGGRSDLPTIWIDSNIHAREWISSATSLYIINEILSGTSADAIDMRTNYRWYILPNANPDGYQYSWDSDRQWRKTRSVYSGAVCTGTDPNRNWDVNWSGSGSSTSPCSDTYCGPSAFSEAETQNMRDFLTSIASSTNVAITIHSYSQLWLIPYGSYTFKPADYDELERVGNLAATAINNVNGLRFEVGTPPDILYVASGGSFDWTKMELDMAYSYAPELRPATSIQGGFEIDASNITPSGREMFAAVVSVARNAQHKV